MKNRIAYLVAGIILGAVLAGPAASAAVFPYPARNPQRKKMTLSNGRKASFFL